MYPYEEKSGYKKGLATEVQPSITFFSQLLMDLQYPNFAQPPAQPDDHKNHCQERKEEGEDESLRSTSHIPMQLGSMHFLALVSLCAGI